MDIGNMWGFGLAGGLSLAGVILLLGWWKSRSKNKSKIKEAVYELFQKERKKEIKSLEQRQSIVKVEIKENETLAVEKEKKIRDIADKASEKVEKILKEDNIENIHDEIVNDWGDL